MAYIGNIPAEAYTNTVKDSFNGNGSTTAFTLSRPTVTNDVRVVVENVIQDPTVAYSVSGTTLTFTSAPPAGTGNIYVVHLGPAVMTAIPPSEIADATTFASSVTVQGAFTSLGIDDNATSTAMTLDTSGNLLVGTTSTSLATTSSETGAMITDGSFQAAANNPVAQFNRITSDGAIVNFRKDGTTVGSIGTVDGDIYVGTGDTGLFFSDANNQIRPYDTSTQNSVDATIDLGRTTSRFKDLYLSGGVYLGGVAAANKLDDYEEGTWTPTIKGGTSAGTGTYSIQEGFYRKVGQLIFVSAYMTWTAHTGTGAFVFVLPFTPNVGGFKYSSMTIGYASFLNWGASNTSPNVHVAPNVAEAYLGYSTNNSSWTQSSINTTGSVIISGCYSAA